MEERVTCLGGWLVGAAQGAVTTAVRKAGLLLSCCTYRLAGWHSGILGKAVRSNAALKPSKINQVTSCLSIFNKISFCTLKEPSQLSHAVNKMIDCSEEEH